MLKRLKIEGFRTLQNVEIDGLRDITALIGRNGAGKTNILRALLWLSRTMTRTAIPPALLPRTAIEIEVEFSGKRYVYSLQRVHTYGRRNDGTAGVTATVQEGFWRLDRNARLRLMERVNEDMTAGPLHGTKVNLWSSALPALLALLPAEHSVSVEIRPFMSFMSRIRYYPIDEPCSLEDENNWIDANKYQAWFTKYNETGEIDESRDSVLMRLIYLYNNHADKLAAMVHLLGKNGIDLINAINIMPLPGGSPSEKKQDEQKPITFYLISFNLPSIKAAFAYNQLSTGTRRILKIVTSLFSDQSSVMLLEHPEDGIHSGLVRKLTAILKTNSGPTQVILTSHSSTMLNDLSPADIHMIAMSDGRTLARRLNSDQVKAADEYMAEKGTLDEYLQLIQEE